MGPKTMRFLDWLAGCARARPWLLKPALAGLWLADEADAILERLRGWNVSRPWQRAGALAVAVCVALTVCPWALAEAPVEQNRVVDSGSLVTVQPENAAVNEGETAVFSVEALAEAGFQWQRGDGQYPNDLTVTRDTLAADQFIWTDIPGADGAEYRFEATVDDLDDYGPLYRCAVTLGGVTAFSRTVKAQRPGSGREREAQSISGAITANTTWNDGDIITGAVTISGGTEANPITIIVDGTVTGNQAITVESGAYALLKGNGGTDDKIVWDSFDLGNVCLWAYGSLRTENITLVENNLNLIASVTGNVYIGSGTKLQKALPYDDTNLLHATVGDLTVEDGVTFSSSAGRDISFSADGKLTIGGTVDFSDAPINIDFGRNTPEFKLTSQLRDTVKVFGASPTQGNPVALARIVEDDEGYFAQSGAKFVSYHEDYETYYDNENETLMWRVKVEAPQPSTPPPSVTEPAGAGVSGGPSGSSGSSGGGSSILSGAADMVKTPLLGVVTKSSGQSAGGLTDAVTPKEIAAALRKAAPGELSVLTGGDTLTLTPKARTAALFAGAKGLDLALDAAVVGLDRQTLRSLPDGAAISAAPVDPDTLPASLRRRLGGTAVEVSCSPAKAPGGWITVEIPCALAEGQSPSDLLPVYVDGQGAAYRPREYHYDAERGVMAVRVRRFGVFGVGSASGVRPPDAALPDEKKRYIVREGDSLWAVAVRHGCTVEELARINGLAPGQVFHPGRQLKLP